MSKNIYIPIEVAKRETLPKSFLAAALAGEGFTVYLFEDYLFDKYGYPGPGFYIGKNCFKTEVPYSLEHYWKIKKQGINILYLDEEGGIYSGLDKRKWEERIIQRTDPESFCPEDYYFAWGSWQGDVFSKYSKANVIVTGSPNYEICKPIYENVLKKIDIQIRGNDEKYILVNTRFTLANPAENLGEPFSEDSPSSKLVDTDVETSSYTLDYIYLGLFLNMIKNIATSFMDMKIVVRPHPAENPQLYSIVFRKYKNIEVRSDGNISTWLRNAVAVVHTGCSTALQGVMANKDVISYVPSLDHSVQSSADIGLPNKVGIRAGTVEEIIEIINKLLTHKNHDFDNNKSIFNDTVADVDSIKTIVNILNKINSNSKYDNEKSLHDTIILYYIKCNIMLRRFFSKRMQKKDNFDRLEYDKIPLYIEAASDYYFKTMKADKICEGLFRVRMSKL